MEDNGKGMTVQELAEKNRELERDTMKRQSSIGIANVNRRLKAVYGSAYGIRMEARQGGGLRVILRFEPRKTGRENQGEGEVYDEEGNDSRR